MPADEDVRAEPLNKRPRTDVIMTRIAADMGHQHLHSAALEKLMSGIVHADILSVAIPVHSHKWLEISYLLRELCPTAEIPGVPELIHRLQEFAEFVGKYPVGIRNQSYIHSIKKARRQPDAPEINL